MKTSDTVENNNVLLVRLEIGNNQAPVDLTFDTLYIPDKEKYPELGQINFNASKRPFFHRYKRYKRGVLRSAGYPGVLVYFFDRRKFKELLAGGDSSGEANDEVLRENIYLTLYYLFPTGYPTPGNIHFSANKIASGSGMGFSPEGGSGFMNFLNPIFEINPATNPVAKVSWFQKLWQTFRGKRQFSYIKRDKTYTINEAIWKNDLYNHPTYRKFLRSIYTYISWGVRYKKNTILVSSLIDGKTNQKSVIKIDKQIEDVRREFVISLKSFITENYKFFCQNATAYKNLRSIIVYSNSIYLFAQILVDLETKIKEREFKILKLTQEGGDIRHAYDNNYRIRSLRTEVIEYLKIKSSLETFFSNEIDKIDKIKKDAFITKKEDTQTGETIFSTQERDVLYDYIYYAERGHKKDISTTHDDKESIQKIRKIYKDRGIVEELKYLKDFISRKRERTSDNNSLLEKYAKYVYFLDAKEAIEQNKMVPIQSAYLIDDKYYKAAFDSSGELEPIKKLYSTDYREFQNELGGDEGTNPVLNRIIYDFLNGQSDELAECAIWFHHFVLEDKSLLIDSGTLAAIETRVLAFNKNWQNIYTGIRAEYITSQQFVNGNRQPVSSRPSNEYTIYVCLNAFDQELNEEILETFKCYIKNNTIGDMAIRLLNKSSDVKEESVREKYLIQSIIQNIPTPDNESLKEKTKSMKQITAKKGGPQRPIVKQGGTRRPITHRRRSTYKRPTT